MEACAVAAGSDKAGVARETRRPWRWRKTLAWREPGCRSRQPLRHFRQDRDAGGPAGALARIHTYVGSHRADDDPPAPLLREVLQARGHLGDVVIPPPAPVYSSILKTYSSLGSPGRNFSRAASVTSVRFVTAAAPFDGWFRGRASEASRRGAGRLERQEARRRLVELERDARARDDEVEGAAACRAPRRSTPNLSALLSTWTSQPNDSDMTSIGAEM